MNWTPAQVGGLTMYQLKMFYADEKELGGKTTISGKDYAKKVAEDRAAGRGPPRPAAPTPRRRN